MRILAGRFKGSHLRAPRAIRPTSGKVRAALFNIVGEAIAGARVMDVCAGSGAVGFEALSRGARAVTWIEADPSCVRIIQGNLTRLGLMLGPHLQLVRQDACTALQRLSRTDAQFDLIFLDPPYRDISLLKRALRIVEGSAILAPIGWVAVEHSQPQDFPQFIATISVIASYRYGDTRLTFLQSRTKHPED